MRHIRGALLGMAGIFLGLVPGIRADGLQLKNGNFVQGKYLGGTERALQFEVNGKIQLYDINQILSISFAAASADGGVPSNNAEAKPTSGADLHAVAQNSPELDGTAWGQTKTKAPEYRVQRVTWQIAWKRGPCGSEMDGPAKSLGSDSAVAPGNPDAKRRTLPEGTRVARIPQRIDLLPD